MSSKKIPKIDLKPKKEKIKIFLNKETWLIRLGVFILTAVIFIFWFTNLKNVWNFSGGFEDFSEIKEIIEEPVPELENFEFDPFSSAEETEKREENNKKEETEKLLEEVVKELNQKATSSSSLNCPEWINCMPTIGTEARSCQIPPGCEGITQIVY